jgi:hypothetical protein
MVGTIQTVTLQMTELVTKHFRILEVEQPLYGTENTYIQSLLPIQFSSQVVQDQEQTHIIYDQQIELEIHLEAIGNLPMEAEQLPT